MDNNKRSVSSDVITRAYLDSLLLEMRHIDAVMPSTKLSLYGKEFSTPVTTGALSHLHNHYPNGMVEMAKGGFMAGAVVFSGMGPKEELEGMINTGASVIKIIKPYADRKSIYDKIRHAEDMGALAVGIDTDHAFSKSRGYDEIEGMEMYPMSQKEILELVKSTSLPFVIKGVLSLVDAKKCLDAGVSGMVISHHNGRINSAVPPLMILPEIASEVKGRVPLFVDCSIQTGLDVFKALALGATACSVGRPLMARLKENGAQGVCDGINEITKDLKYTMAMTASKDITAIDPSIVRMGSFVW
ncbi:MAG: alpha-hydroxy-acid oxidizing protein [Clostridiales bacterium]|nr:alpha-hydroxy-acid oxidizing protein [Clostridiales bacterium]